MWFKNLWILYSINVYVYVRCSMYEYFFVKLFFIKHSIIKCHYLNVWLSTILYSINTHFLPHDVYECTQLNTKKVSYTYLYIMSGIYLGLSSTYKWEVIIYLTMFHNSVNFALATIIYSLICVRNIFFLFLLCKKNKCFVLWNF